MNILLFDRVCFENWFPSNLCFKKDLIQIRLQLKHQQNL